jgi:hypothetical protein
MGKGGGSTPTSQTVQQSNIPEYARPYFEDIMTRGQAASQAQYQPYTGERIAPFSPMQQQAFQGISQLGPSPLLGTAAGLTGLGAQQAAQAGQYTPLTAGEVFGRPGAMVGTGSFAQPGVAGAYMSPYMQNVVDIQTREAQRQADVARTGRQAQATGAGAFGGSRQAIMEAEAARNLAQQKGDIQAQGQQAAFQQAQQAYQTDAARRLQARLANQQAGLAGLQAAEQSRQFGAGLGMQGVQQLLGAAGQMGQLGQTAYGQQMGALQAQQQAGAQQQAQAQQMRDLGYEEFMRQQYYPQSQLQFLSSLLRGSVVAPQQTQYSYQQAPSLASQLGGIGVGMYGLSKMKEGGEVKSYALGGVTEGAFASNISKLVKLGLSDPRLIDRDRTATPLEKQLAKAEVMRMRQASSNQQALDRGIPSEEPILSAGVGSLDTPEFTAAEGGIVAFQQGGTSEATAKYQQAISQSWPVEFGRRLGAGVADIVRLPGAVAWEIDPVTGKLRRRYEQEGFFPISRDVADKGAGSERGASGEWSPGQGGAQPLAPFVTPDGRRVVDQIPGQNVAPAAPAGIDFQTANAAAQQAGLGSLRQARSLNQMIADAARSAATTSPPAPPPAPRGPGGIASPAAPTAVPSELSDMQRRYERMVMEGQKLETPEEAEERIRKGYEEKFPSELPERLKELTAEAQSAVKARDQDRWLAVAMGGFAAAAGESPYALKNFAQGLGLTTKEFLSINKDFQAAEKERKKMELALRQQDRAERMGIEGKVLDARERASKAHTEYDKFLADVQLKIATTGIYAELTRKQIAATREGAAETRAARYEDRKATRKDALAQRYGREVNDLAKLILSGMGPSAVTDPNAAVKAEVQARRIVLQRNPQYNEVAGEVEAPAVGGIDLTGWGKPSRVGAN